ncbi:MAG: NTPase KAP [Phenylobacterium sp.]|uniref:Qat anti-phage system ATPase QatA n=1 Tax=Phenylobacterium sp. TaxID=1871053 RepID=UPI0025E19447|nr:Qat anti-phage system ATPase QatA [Phenylobacterium sp.]MBT9470851.1 NTPase KAP [Phenylobacterium sp.]
MTAPAETLFLSDQETAVDLLYYEAVARTVVRLIRQSASVPVTIGVHGDWGAGKSSVLKMTAQAFEGEKRVVTLWFNGWVFEGFEDAKTVVIETLVAELRRARPTSTKVAEAAKKVLKRVDWLKVAQKAGGLAFTAATGIPSPDLLKSLYDGLSGLVANPGQVLTAENLKALTAQAGGLLKAAETSPDTVPDQMHAFREEFDALLDAADIDQLVVLIDDLDRCLPETAISTLEAIRLFLFVPRTAFVIAADEAMIEYSVRRHFPDLPASSGPMTYARNYLEKLIQVPFRIPALGLAETRAYVTLLLTQRALGEGAAPFQALLAAAREDLRRPWASRGLDRKAVQTALAGVIPKPVEEALRISAQVTRLLTDGTRGNPRQIKRFLNSMALRQAIADERGFGDEIELPVLAKVMLAERFAPDLYEQLSRLAATAANGKVPALAALEAASPEGEAATPSRKVKAGSAAAPEVEDWLKSDWAKGWATIEPGLADIDLRPYVFVTRDKRSFFAGVIAADHLEALVERLSGSAMAARSAEGEVGRLNDAEAEQVFDALQSRILSAERLTSAPAGVPGLALLARLRPPLQRRLLGFLQGLPIDSVGGWAVTSWAGAFVEPGIVSEFASLQQTWATSATSAGLKAAAVASSKLKRPS